MSPYEKIAQKYFDNPQEAPFGDYVEWFLRNGYVFSTPEYFVMGKNCRRLAPVEAVQSMPYKLPWIAFERLIDNKRDLRFYETADLKRLTD